LEQNRLSDARLAPDHDRSPAIAKTVYQRVEDSAFLLTLDQLWAGVDHGHPAHRASMTASDD